MQSMRLVNWLNASKISLNVKKTEMIIFKSKQNKLEGDLVLNTWVQKLIQTLLGSIMLMIFPLN